VLMPGGYRAFAFWAVVFLIAIGFSLCLIVSLCDTFIVSGNYVRCLHNWCLALRAYLRYQT